MTPRLRIGLVGCSKKKFARTAPARQLYVSPLFRAALRYAEAKTDLVFVVSAGHGLVALDQVLQPYNATMRDVRDKGAWGKRVVTAIARAVAARPTWTPCVDLVILAGAAYATPIVRHARQHDGWTTEEPLLGLQPVSKRIVFLQEALAR
jgi:hypothetical protein